MSDLRTALIKAADLIDRAPELHSDYLDPVLPRAHQLARVGIEGIGWVLLRHCQPVAHASGDTAGDALRSLAQKY